MRIFDPKRRFIEFLTGRLDRLEEEQEREGEGRSVDSDPGVPYATAEELNQMTPEERWEYRFNWRVREIMPYYKAEVMCLHNITSDEEYTRRVLEGDQSIYLLQPNRKFEPTWYDERVAHALGLDYQQLQDKFKRGELKHWIPGCDSNDCSKSGTIGNTWYDEYPIVF